MAVFIPALIVLATVVAMEWVAWASHKYIMHGFGWGWHRDHHEPHDNLLEKNDLYAVVGAAMSISMFALGSEWVMGEGAWWPATWIGLGIMAYGVIYTLVHDGLVHQRYFKWVPKSGYAKRLVQAQPGSTQGRIAPPARSGHRHRTRKRRSLRPRRFQSAVCGLTWRSLHTIRGSGRGYSPAASAPD